MRRLLPALFALASLAGGPKAFALNACNDCNVILISIDTLAASHLGVYGGSSKISPALDKFAGESRLYARAYAAAPWTLPSHAAMLTGIYPWLQKVSANSDSVPLSIPYLPQILREAGYRTAAFTSGPFITDRFGFKRGFQEFTRLENRRDAADIVRESTQWLKAHARQKFFLFLHSFHVHTPLAPSKEAAAFVDPEYKGAVDSVDEDRLWRIAAKSEKAEPKDLERIAALYDAGIYELDRELEKFFAHLKESGLLRNTIVIVTADHGEEFGEHGKWGFHVYSVYEELLRVPLLIHIPDEKPAKFTQPVSLVDLVPTVLAALKIPRPGDLSGVVLGAAETGSADRAILAETSIHKDVFFSRPPSARKADILVPQRAGVTSARTTKALIQGDFKLISNLEGTLELYDLKSDPREKLNRMDKDKETAFRLMAKMLSLF